jgi:hypothetical protein
VRGVAQRPRQHLGPQDAHQRVEAPGPLAPLPRSRGTVEGRGP